MPSGVRRHSETAVSSYNQASSGVPPPEQTWQPHAGFDDLPIYVGPDETARSEHAISLRNGDVPWLTLKVRSSAGQATSRPLFFDGASIDGSVHMVLTSAQSIHAVNLLLEGRSRAAWDFADARIFLSMPLTLWRPEGSTGNKMPPGTYDWPFSLQLPRKIKVDVEGKPLWTTLPPTYSSADNKQIFWKLPPTYTASSLAASVDYELQVTIQRGALRKDDHLTTAVVFLPRSRPAPASTLRQLAYLNGRDLVGPRGDPEGWHTISRTIKATVFSKLDVEIVCSFSLAKPLVYARETSIPFVVSFESQDTQAADLLCQPTAVKVALAQSVAVRSQSAVVTIVGRGTCFLGGTRDRRRLEGEIPVRRHLKPPFSVGLILSYAVTLYIETAGFAPADEFSFGPILSQEVGIATDRPEGPRQYASVPDDETVPEYFPNTAGGERSP